MADSLGKQNEPVHNSGDDGSGPDSTDGDAALAEPAMLRVLFDRALAAHEEERLRLARALHDDLAQKLTALSIELSLLMSALAGAEPPGAQTIRAKLSGPARLAEALIQSTRGLAAELRPAVVEEFGLAAGLADLAREVGCRRGVACSFQGKPPMKSVKPACAREIYRCVGELIAALVCSAPTTVRIHLQQDGAWLEVRVVADAAGSSQPLDAILVAGLRERTRRLGGTLEFHASPADGTVAVLRVPAGSAGDVPDVPR